MPDADDTIRPPVGIVVSLRDLGNGMSKLMFDDVSNNSTEESVIWNLDHSLPLGGLGEARSY
jgi:hypothetical protein